VFEDSSLATVLETFDLGDGILSPEPVAYGRVGEIWRLDATSGSWAVKTERNEVSEEGLAPSVRFHEGAVAAGICVPRIRRTRDGWVVADVANRQIRVLEWVDMAAADPRIDPVAVGRVMADLHQLPEARWSAATDPADDVDPWFRAPIGGSAWDDLLAELGPAGAPFAPALAAHRDEMVALEGLLAAPRELRWCHRDLFSDNVRAIPEGGIVVFDFDNSGPCDPAWEVAFVLVEYATTEGVGDAGVDVARAQALCDAYRERGGPARLRDEADFTMIVAVLGHITEIASRRWLAATEPTERNDLAAWAAEITDRPLTRRVIEQLLEACTL
jgi:Ser/Thr protein kinase RdoA (MazF antagonist)